MTPDEVNHCVAACQQGDREAFSLLVLAFQQKIYGLCWQYLRDQPAAMDAAADVFCKAYAAMDRFDPSRPFASWILTIATRHLLQIRRTGRRRGIPADWPEQEPTADQEDPEEEMLRLSDQQQVQAALKTIPDRYRMILHLRYFEDLSYEEIARILQAPVNTVGSLVSRARKSMRKALPHREETP